MAIANFAAIELNVGAMPSTSTVLSGADLISVLNFDVNAGSNSNFQDGEGVDLDNTEGADGDGYESSYNAPLNIFSGATINLLGGGTVSGSIGVISVNDPVEGERFFIIIPQTVVNALAGADIISIDLGPSVSTSKNFQLGNFAAVVDFGLVCFAKGTLIGKGNRIQPVENIEIGDRIQTIDRGLQTVRWVGRTTVVASGDFAPIVFAKNAIGNARELVVSPQHRVLLKGWRADLLFGEPEVLIAAKHLVNGETIYTRQGGLVSYYHLLFDKHELLISEGVATESFYPGKYCVDQFERAARDEIYALFPELRDGSAAHCEHVRPSLRSFEVAAWASAH